MPGLRWRGNGRDAAAAGADLGLGRLIRGRLWLQVLLGMLLGLAVGATLGPSVGWVSVPTATLLTNWLVLPGQLFLAVIQMIVVPLIFASIILGLAAGGSVTELRRLGGITALFFGLTTAVAAVIGLWVTELLGPGRGLGPPAAKSFAGPDPAALPGLTELPERLIAFLPGNPLSSMVEGEMLQVVVFAMFVGVALVSLAADARRPLLDLLASLRAVCMTVVSWAMRLAPLAVFGFMTRITSQLGAAALLGMVGYVLTVLLGLALLFAGYLVLLRALAGHKPMEFLRQSRELLLLAFSTSSSAAVMPLSIRTAEETLGVRPAVARFVIPLGATVNMNGTALYQGAATAFLAQVYGIDIGMSGMALVVVMAVGASVGSPATPGVGIVILATVLASVGIPPAGLALIMGVDRILDMSRTAINVAGDLVACRVVERFGGAAPNGRQ